MELGTMTNLFFVKNSPDKKGYVNSIRKTAEYGFKVIDLCMCPVQREETELNLDGEWEKIAYEIRNEAEKCGVRLIQSHLPYPTRRISRDKFGPEAELNERFRELFRRCIIVSSIVGTKWAVAHPVTACDGLLYSPENNLKYNHEVYDELVEFAQKHNVGIAFENMCDVNNGYGHRKYTATANELCELIDSYNAPESVGACWDFGHANRTYPEDQTEALRLVGNRLRATHVDDNVGKDDLHCIPFCGMVKWDRVMPVLHEINYHGPFVFELNLRGASSSEYILDATVKHVYNVGQHLISLAK